MSRRVRITQAILAMIALALVSTLFLGGMVGGRSRDVPASPNTPGPVTPSPVPSGERLPGVPEIPVAQHETFPAEPGANADRQLAYEPQGAPEVDLAEGLGGHADYATQVVDWALCDDGSGAQCATVTAPLDWDDPDGDAVEIAVRRVIGGDSSRGPLFVNPGGPGFGGQEMAQRLAGRWENYDTVGWDPRGTGQSTRVVCGGLAETDDFMALDGSPDDAAEDRALRDGSADFAQDCRDASGDLLDHLTTIDVARDLDLLRHLLGAEKLTYVGVSYGTYVGAMYAELFPGSVGRLVLDAAVDITGDDEAPPQSAGFERALGNFAQWCAESELCDLGDDRDAIVDGIGAFLSGLDARPLPVGDRELTQTLAAAGIALFLYEDEEAYRTLAEVIAQGQGGDGGALLQAADLMNGRSPGGYDTIAYAFPAMVCADVADRGMDAVPDEWRDTFDDAPLMAPHLGMSYTCETWTAAPAPQIRITAAGAPPILVVGTTGDSATPYEQAVAMAEQLESGVLLTLDGAGHGAVTGDNECIAEAVDRYLFDGEVPEDGTTCG
ncbi:alpha/beta hydrolase [Tessaracoccus lapidicaptus]|uniref:alpha/beta hydrolase n=1 Tax=Tessaracoccus lapidicaptus TaxID=1427523 RepID=UPI000B07FCB1|nr:alpha/beta hydrolase [Tessaracoccus lapidicaptus]